MKRIITNEPNFIKEAQRLNESYLSDYTKSTRAEISIVFNEKGNYKHTVIEYKKGNRLATENFHRDGSDKQGGAKRSFLSSVDKIIKNKDLKINPPTKQCQPQNAFFFF